MGYKKLIVSGLFVFIGIGLQGMVLAETTNSIVRDSAGTSIGLHDSVTIPVGEAGVASTSTDSGHISTVTIEGLIVDSISGLPLKGVVVTPPPFATGSVRTDSTGSFVLTTARKSSYTIDISDARYQSRTVYLNGDKANFFITCRLIPVAGTVNLKSAVGEPVAEWSKVPWTISGCVIDSKLDLPLKKISITMTFDGQYVAVSKESSFRLATNTGGKHLLRMSASGYQDVITEIVLDKSDMQPFVTLATAKTEEKIRRREIMVTARRESLHSTASVSETKISRAEAVNAAATTNDPVRVLQTLPGVASQSDMSARPVVRGGDVLEGRAFIDGIPLIQPYHYGGARSTFNQLAMDRIDFYKSGFPSQFENAQSSIIAVESRKPYLSSPVVDFDINLLQADIYTGIPIVKDRIGLNFSFQGSWQDFMMKRTMDGIAFFQNDSTTTNEIEFIKDNVNLPDYRDGSAGFGIRLNDKAEIYINESFNTDVCNFTRQYYSDGITVEYDSTGNLIPSDTNFSSVSPIVYDTFINYNSYYNVLYGTGTYTPDAVTVYTLSLAWQRRWWDLHFPELWQPLGRPEYNVSIDQWNAHGGWLYSGVEKHLFHVGVQLDFTRADYSVNLLRILHQVIVEGNTNFGDYLGPITGDSGTTSLTGVFGIAGFGPAISRLLLRYEGSTSFVNSGIYFEDEWTPSLRLTVNLGGRFEFSTADLALNVSPRFSAKYKLNDAHELIGALGHYTQNNYELAALALSDELKPEKVWHASLGEEWRMLPWLTLKTDLYGKYYFDLGSEVIGMNYKSIVDSLLAFSTPGGGTPNFSAYSLDSLLRGNQIFYSGYVNKGRGLSGGIELQLRYDPADFWNGWASVTLNSSYRQRQPGWRWHSFPLDRPLLFSLVNFYRLPRNYEISVKYRYMSGIPYTAITFNDSVQTISPYNNERYAEYHRLDFKVSKGFELFHRKGHVYIEVWNALNTPNFMLVDSKNQKVRSFDLNWPITLMFIGMDYSF